MAAVIIAGFEIDSLTIGVCDGSTYQMTNQFTKALRRGSEGASGQRRLIFLAKKCQVLTVFVRFCQETACNQHGVKLPKERFVLRTLVNSCYMRLTEEISILKTSVNFLITS
jgi:hypothetical protein